MTVGDVERDVNNSQKATRNSYIESFSTWTKSTNSQNKLDAELLPPVSYIAEYVKTRDNRGLSNKLREFFRENPEEVEKLNRMFKTLERVA